MGSPGARGQSRPIRRSSSNNHLHLAVAIAIAVSSLIAGGDSDYPDPKPDDPSRDVATSASSHRLRRRWRRRRRESRLALDLRRGGRRRCGSVGPAAARRRSLPGATADGSGATGRPECVPDAGGPGQRWRSGGSTPSRSRCTRMDSARAYTIEQHDCRRSARRPGDPYERRRLVTPPLDSDLAPALTSTFGTPWKCSSSWPTPVRPSRRTARQWAMCSLRRGRPSSRWTG